MRSGNGGTVQAYNAQVASSVGPVIVGVGVTNETTDYHQLIEMLGVVFANLAGVGIDAAPNSVVADAGYLTEENLAAAEQTERDRGTNVFIATRSRRSAAPRPDNEAPTTDDDNPETTGQDDVADPTTAEEALRRWEQELAAIDAAEQAQRARRVAVFERVAAGELALKAAAAELGLSYVGTTQSYRKWRRGGAEAVAVPRRPRPERPDTFEMRKRAMAAKVADNRDIYRQRAPVAEGAISHLTTHRGTRRGFRRRGLSAVTSELTLWATAHNLTKFRTTLTNLVSVLALV